jgi:transposase
LEEEISRQTRGVEQAVAQEAAQKKADQAPPHCPKCGSKLIRLSQGHQRTLQTRFGPITIKRHRGWCRRCKRWFFPADALLGIAETGSASPSVQEMVALVASKMPISEASAVIKRLTGVEVPPATLDREARRQGQRAQRKQAELDEQMRSGQGASQQAKELQLELPLPSFTLVIQLDSWNIRERDDWGKSRQKRAGGQEPKRWHWVYGGTCFRLSERVKSARGRAMILNRGTVMTRIGIDALREQLYAESLRQGLGQATEVLVIADGAPWIWNLVEDRFEQARQRLDLFHAKEHLWTLAHALRPDNEAAARAWVQPLLKKLASGRPAKLIHTLKSLAKRLRRRRKRKLLKQEIGYFEANAERMDYAQALKRGEPVGSGPMESTCRQYQCRFKRPGQFWSEAGDEALMCLETFWRNHRWHLLFPHVGDPSKN